VTAHHAALGLRVAVQEPVQIQASPRGKPSAAAVLRRRCRPLLMRAAAVPLAVACCAAVERGPDLGSPAAVAGPGLGLYPGNPGDRLEAPASEA